MRSAFVRRGAALLALVAAAGLGGGPAAAAPDAGPSQVRCGAKAYIFLFWPRGHPAVVSVGFPKFPPPHLEVYTGTDRKVPSGNQVGYVGEGQFELSPACAKVKAKLGGLSESPVQQRSVVTDKAQIVCAFPKAVDLQVRPIASADQRIRFLAILPPNKIVLDALIVNQLVAGSSQLRYSSYCKKEPAPK